MFETVALRVTLMTESPGYVFDEVSVEVPLNQGRRRMWERFFVSTIFGSMDLGLWNFQHLPLDAMLWIVVSC
jgi:hypothetical protein